MKDPFAPRQGPREKSLIDNDGITHEVKFECAICGKEAGRDPNGELCHTDDHVIISGSTIKKFVADHTPTRVVIEATGREVR